MSDGVELEPHEYETVWFFLKRGKDIELIPPSNTFHARRADFWMDALEWESKSPETMTKIAVERTLHKALRQSCNVMIDLRRAKGKDSDDVVLNHLRKCFLTSRRIKRLHIITRKQELIDYCR